MLLSFFVFFFFKVKSISIPPFPHAFASHSSVQEQVDAAKTTKWQKRGQEPHMTA